jgi:hypothetical protein
MTTLPWIEFGLVAATFAAFVDTVRRITHPSD